EAVRRALEARRSFRVSRLALDSLAPAAALAGPGGRDLVGGVLQLVIERCEVCVEAAVCKRVREQTVGEPWIAGEQRAVQIRAVDAAFAAAFEAGDAVVAEAVDDPAERLGAVVEDRPPCVVLEAGQRLAGPGAVEQHVADHALLAGLGV